MALVYTELIAVYMCSKSCCNLNKLQAGIVTLFKSQPARDTVANIMIKMPSSFSFWELVAAMLDFLEYNTSKAHLLNYVYKHTKFHKNQYQRFFLYTSYYVKIAVFGYLCWPRWIFRNLIHQRHMYLFMSTNLLNFIKNLFSGFFSMPVTMLK